MPAPATPRDAVGVYLHVPFCTHICPYCDFNTYRGMGSVIPRYVAAVEREVAERANLVERRQVGSVYIGGGTPSLLSPAEIARLVNACRQRSRVEPDAEVTLEANPNGLDAERLEGYRRAGVNRLSLGGQTLSQRGLRVLGRLHEPSDIAAAVSAARAAGFDNVSIDLIFGWPGQTLAEWRDDLDRVLGGALGAVPEHLSLYSLIVEPGTPMADAVTRGILVAPDDDAAADMYELALDRLAAADWHHYEVANWAADPTRRSQHNLLYWRNGEYLGCGAGAHGQVGGRRWMNHLAPLTYIRAVEGGQQPTSNLEEIPPPTAMGETMMLGLRLLEQGVSRAAFVARHGLSLEDAFRGTVDRLVDLGMLTDDDTAVRLTRRGLLLANDVCAEFLP